MDILNNSIVTDADTEVLDSQITQISNDFSETYYFDSEQEEELELLVAKAMKLGELYERKKWQAAKAQAVPEWINVNLLSPQVDTEVLVCVGDDVKTAIYRDLDGEGYFEGVFGAKWWMPKPKAQEPAND